MLMEYVASNLLPAEAGPAFSGSGLRDFPKTLNTKTLNPETLSPKTLNPNQSLLWEVDGPTDLRVEVAGPVFRV